MRCTLLDVMFVKQQHVLLGALSAIETFVGAVLALPLLAGLTVGVRLLVQLLGGRHSYQLHHYLNVHASVYLFTGACTVLSGVLLWAGLALMRGRPYRYRAQGVLFVTVLALLLVRAVTSALA